MEAGQAFMWWNLEGSLGGMSLDIRGIKINYNILYAVHRNGWTAVIVQ